MKDFLFFIVFIIVVIVPTFIILFEMLAPKIGEQVHKIKMNNNDEYRKNYEDNRKVEKENWDKQEKERRLQREAKHQGDDPLPF